MMENQTDNEQCRLNDSQLRPLRSVPSQLRRRRSDSYLSQYARERMLDYFLLQPQRPSVPVITVLQTLNIWRNRAGDLTCFAGLNLIEQSGRHWPCPTISDWV
jgi:hypothetical protein